MKEKQFKCPSCKSPVLEEILRGVTVVSRVDRVSRGGDVIYGGQINTDGEFDRFQCGGCGLVIPEVQAIDELFNWIQENC